jgi:hypothetical protein
MKGISGWREFLKTIKDSWDGHTRVLARRCRLTLVLSVGNGVKLNLPYIKRGTNPKKDKLRFFYILVTFAPVSSR